MLNVISSHVVTIKRKPVFLCLIKKNPSPVPPINQLIEYERKQNVNKIMKCRHEFKNIRCNGKVCAQFDHYPESRFGHSGWLSGLIYKQGQGVIWESSKQQKQSAGQRVNNPFFNMPLTLPSSIKTNDLSAMRHGGGEQLWSCFPERRDVTEF